MHVCGSLFVLLLGFIEIPGCLFGCILACCFASVLGSVLCVAVSFVYIDAASFLVVFLVFSGSTHHLPPHLHVQPTLVV